MFLKSLVLFKCGVLNNEKVIMNGLNIMKQIQKTFIQGSKKFNQTSEMSVLCAFEILTLL